jgi:hypothetical protein
MELYLHFPIRRNGVVLDLLSTGTTSAFTVYCNVGKESVLVTWGRGMLRPVSIGSTYSQTLSNFIHKM